MRTDPHRPGAILPTDYSWVASFGMTTIPGEEPEFYGYEDVPEGPFAEIHGGLQACDVCGARYNHGVVLLHKPTGVHITIGHDCANKYSLPMDLAGWKAWHAAKRDQRKLAAIEMKYATAAREWKAANPAAGTALDLVGVVEHNPTPAIPVCSTHGPLSWWETVASTPEGDARYREFEEGGCRECYRLHNQRARHFDRKNGALDILADMGRKLARFGSLSEKQAAFAVKLGETVRTWKAQDFTKEEAHVPAPEGRVTFTGTIVSIKEREGYMGGVEYKMTVKVTTPEGTWLAWMTAPGGTEKGQTVNVTATLTRGSDAHFAFGKRPVILTDAAANVKAAKRAARDAKRATQAA